MRLWVLDISLGSCILAFANGGLLNCFALNYGCEIDDSRCSGVWDGLKIDLSGSRRQRIAVSELLYQYLQAAACMFAII